MKRHRGHLDAPLARPEPFRLRISVTERVCGVIRGVLIGAAVLLVMYLFNLDLGDCPRCD